MPSITRRRISGAQRSPSAEAGILDTTHRLLVDGIKFTELGVQHICAEAGVARSTFYHHFRDKTELLLRLAATMRNASFETISGWEAQDGVDCYAEAFLRVVKLYREQAAILRAIAEVAAYDSAVREFWHEGLARFMDRTVAVLREEQDAGRASGGLNLTSAARVIVVAGERAIFDHIEVEEPTRDADFARELASIWWYGAFRRPAD
ncbi:TetR/AcrR family transcriptional regulator [Amycolatopsis sp. NPDC004368]